MSKELSNVTVDAVSQYGLRIGDNWYNGKLPEGVKKGDVVSLSYELKGKFRNIVGEVSVKEVVKEEGLVVDSSHQKIKTFVSNDTSHLDNSVNTFCGENNVFAIQTDTFVANGSSQFKVWHKATVFYR